MGKIVLYFQMSLDGVVSDPDRWATIDDELMRDSIDRYEEVDAIIFGGRTFQGMAEYWTNAENASESRLEREFAARINAKKKYVASRSAVELVWNNSEHLKFTDIASLAQALDALRRNTARDITVESGTKLWQVLLENSLFDGICAQIHPVIAGHGEKLFDGDGVKETLSVDAVKTFGSGVVKLDYRKEKY